MKLINPRGDQIEDLRYVWAIVWVLNNEFRNKVMRLMVPGKQNNSWWSSRHTAHNTVGFARPQIRSEIKVTCFV